MRNLIYTINLSLDGYVGHEDFAPQPDLMGYFCDLTETADLIVYGRKTYDLMFPYWGEVAKAQSGTPDENRFAEITTNIEKIVFSTTLETAYGNTKILRRNLVEELIKLKQQPGKKIFISGLTLLEQAMNANLIDEFFFVLHPAIIGKGPRLINDFGLTQSANLKLVDTITFKSGCIALHYKNDKA